jgi:CheY-like chemotaxis protein
MPMARILVVEDNAMVRESFVHLLEQRGYDVVEATDGEQALVRLKHVRCDVAIIDVMMPTMGGLELRQELNERLPHLRTIMVTGQPEKLEVLLEDDLEFQTGKMPVLYKPVHPVKLLAEVEKALNRKLQAVAN